MPALLKPKRWTQVMLVVVACCCQLVTSKFSSSCTVVTSRLDRSGALAGSDAQDEAWLWEGGTGETLATRYRGAVTVQYRAPEWSPGSSAAGQLQTGVAYDTAFFHPISHFLLLSLTKLLPYISPSSRRQLE